MSGSTKQVTYIDPPNVCDNCHCKFGTFMYDAKTVYGPWANLCSDCFNVIGVGLGTGLGQQYIKNEAGDWIKNAG